MSNTMTNANFVNSGLNTNGITYTTYTTYPYTVTDPREERKKCDYEVVDALRVVARQLKTGASGDIYYAEKAMRKLLEMGEINLLEYTKALAI